MRPVPLTNTQTPGSIHTWLLCVVLLLATMLNYMDRQTLSLTVTDIYREFGKSEQNYGYTESAFSMAFAAGSLLAGVMVDRWSVYWVYPLVVVMWSIAGFATGFVEGWIDLMICRSLLGLAEAAHWPCALNTTQHLLAPGKRSLGNAILQSGASLGAIVTPLVVFVLVKDSSTWRRPFWVIGVMGLSWVVLWLVIARRGDLPVPSGGPNCLGERSFLGRAILDIIGQRRFWVLVVLVVSINLAWHFFRAWLPSLLNELEYGKTETLLFTSGYYVSTDAGSLAVGFGTLFMIRRGWSVHQSRCWLYFLCSALVALSVLAAILPKGWLILTLLLVIGFGSLGLFPTYYSLTQEISTKHMGIVSGLLGCLTWLATAAMQAGVGAMVERTHSFALGMILNGLAPLAGFFVLLLGWGQRET